MFGTNSFFSTLRKLENEIKILKQKIMELELKLDDQEYIRRSQILRLRNHEELSNDFLIKDMPYLDLPPEKAYRLYSEQDYDFTLLDVSSENYAPPVQLPEAKKIPLEQLWSRISEIQGKGKTLFVISEEGVKSINACKILSQLGFCNVNNISGGYQFWPGQSENFTKPSKDEFEAEFEEAYELDLDKNTNYGEDDFLKEA